MERNYFDSKASLDNALEALLKYTNNWYDIFIEAAKKYQANMKDLEEDKEGDFEGKKAYDEEAEDDAAFANFDRRHVSGYEDEPKCFGGHFGAGFEIDEPRLEDYTDRKKFEDDLAAYNRFVEAGEDCVRRGLEKPEWVDFGESTSVDSYDNEDIPYDDMDDEPKEELAELLGISATELDNILYDRSISNLKYYKLEKELNKKKNEFLDALNQCKPDSKYLQQLRELAKSNEKNEKLCRLIKYYIK